MELTTGFSEKTGRINLFVDGEFAFSVNASLFAGQSLRNGDEITGAQLDELRAAEEYAAAYDKGLSLLEYGDNSAKTLYRKLLAHYSQPASIAAVEKLISLDLVNDERYALRLAESLFRRKGYGKQRIIQVIISKGVERDTAATAVESLCLDENEALSRAIDKMKIDFSDKKSVAKAYRKLYAMGFRSFRLGDFYAED